MITRGNPWGSEAKRNPYPFVDTASLRDATGVLQLNQAWILDAKFWPALTALSRVYLSSVERTKTSLVLTISTLNEVIGVATVTDLTKKRIAFLGSDGSQVGYMTWASGGLQHAHDVPSRVYGFPVQATEFVASALAPQVTGGLRAIGDGKGNVLSAPFYIVGGEGVVLTPQSSGFRVDVVGDPYFFRDTCEDPTALGKALLPVRRIRYKDMTSGGEGVAVPYAGNISTTVIPGTQDPRARGFVSPGPDLAVLSRIGA